MPGPPDRDELLFGSSFTAIRLGQRYIDADTLVHELGHALFDLRDEYVEFGDDVFTRFGYPNCASSVEEAERWWGDLIGQVDPFYYEYATTLDDLGIFHSPSIEDELRTGFVEGGCYGQGDEAIRPTSDSLMNSQVPVLGSVNRLRVEEILDLFSGRRSLSWDELVLELPSLAAFDCDASGWVAETIDCAGSFPSYVDLPPDAAVRVQLVADEPVDCTVSSADGEVGATLSCLAIPAGEEAGIRTLSASAASSFRPTGVVVEINAPPAPEIVLSGATFDEVGRLVVSVNVLEDGRRDELAVDLVPDGDEALSVRRVLGAAGGDVILGVSAGTGEICANIDGGTLSCVALPSTTESASSTSTSSSSVSWAAVVAIGLLVLLVVLAAAVVVVRLAGRRASVGSGS